MRTSAYPVPLEPKFRRNGRIEMNVLLNLQDITFASLPHVAHILREFLCIQTAGPGCSSSSYLAHHVSYLFIHHFMSRFPPQWLLVATRLPRSGKCRLTMSVCVKKPQQFDGLSWHLFFFLSKKYYKPN